MADESTSVWDRIRTRWNEWSWPVRIFVIGIAVAVLWLVFDEPGASGDAVVWSRTYAQCRSAKQGAILALQEFTAERGFQVVPKRAVGDAGDTELEVLLHAPAKGLVGLLVSRVGAQGGTQCNLGLAPPEQFSQLSAPQAPAGGPAPNNQPQPLTPVPLPDRSGTIGLPAGWRITEATKGCVSAVGPEGQVVNLGYFTQVTTPQAAQNMFNFRPPVVAPYDPPQQAIPLAQQQLWDLAERTSGIRCQFGQMLAMKPVPCSLANGRAVLVVYDWQAQGRPMRSLSLVIQAPTGAGTWMYYFSAVASPPQRFSQDVETLMAIWTSRKVAQWVGAQRLRQAYNTMQETTEILQSSHTYRQDVFTQAHKKWVEYIRGRRGVEDQQTGERREVDPDVFDQMQLQDHIQDRNRQGGGRQYREIPTNELIP